MPDDKIQKAASASLELEIGFNGSRYTETAKDNPFHKPISCNIGEEYEKDLAALGGKTKVFNVNCIKIFFQSKIFTNTIFTILMIY